MTKKIKIPIYDEVIILSDDLDLLHKIDEESKEYLVGFISKKVYKILEDNKDD